MKKRNFRKSILLLGLVAIVGVGAISAYFTATDTATNTFEVQKVDVLLEEPNYVDNQQVVPNKTIVKDPTVTNKGTTDEFIFVSVKVPYKNIITAQANGTRNAAADTELFAWNSSTENAPMNVAKGAGLGKVNTGWTLVRTNVGEVDAGTGIGEVEYIYAYGSATEMTALAPGAKTVALFDSVTMCNAIEEQGLETTSVDIDVAVYAIQASDLKESGNGTTAPSEVLKIYSTQKGLSENID